MVTFALGLSWFLILATVVPLIRREAWWIRLLDFPRPQISVLALVAACSLWTVFSVENPLELGTFVLLALCTAYQVAEMSVYTRLRRIRSLCAESEDTDRRIKILAGNVLMTNHAVVEYCRLIERYEPDIVILAEPDQYWERELRCIEDRYPYTIKCPLENTYGLLLYSRLPLADEKVLFRVEEDVPSFSATVRLRTGDLVVLHALHPRPPHVGVDTVERDAELVMLAREVKNTPLPVIVAGDLNDVAWSHTTRLFLRISGLLDPRIGRGFWNTYHAHYPLFRWPIDHLFHSRSFRLVRMERGPQTQSDHFPVFVELSYEPEIRHEQERPIADQEDHEEAERKVENVKARAARKVWATRFWRPDQGY